MLNECSQRITLNEAMHKQLGEEIMDVKTLADTASKKNELLKPSEKVSQRALPQVTFNMKALH